MKLDQGILEQMQEYLQRCPRCKQIWMIFNRRGDDTHQCRACGHQFKIGSEKASVGGLRRAPGAERPKAA